MYPKPRKVSVKWLTKKLECTEESRKICDGKCCKLPNMYAFYTEEEIEKLPPERRQYLEWDEKEGMYRVKKYPDGVCMFIDMCLANPDMKPAFCTLYPLKIDKYGNLVLHRWAVLHCPNYGKGEEIWKGFRDALVKVYGEDFYEREIVRKVKGQKRLVEYVH